MVPHGASFMVYFSSKTDNSARFYVCTVSQFHFKVQLIVNKGCCNCTLERLSKLELLFCSQLNITVASRFENQLSFQTNLLNMHQEKEHKELEDPTAHSQGKVVSVQ